MARGYRNIEKLREQSEPLPPPSGRDDQTDGHTVKVTREVAELGAMEIGGALILNALKGLLHIT